MLYTKYNSTQTPPKSNEKGSSNISKILKQEVDFLLSPSANLLNGVSFDEIYIPVPDVEEFLNPSLSFSNSDRIMYLTGLTGSGKSMILKKVYNIKGMTPRINDKTLVIPFSFDNFTFGEKQLSENDEEGVSVVFENMLNCACELLEKTYTELNLVADNESLFLKTILMSRGDYTESKRKWPRPSTTERLEDFLSSNAIAFFSSMLKFYLNQISCPINNVVILIDDIEGVGENSELVPVKIAYKILTCLENTERSKNWSVNLVISCRNYVYRLISNYDFATEHQQLETYPESEQIHIDNAPTISQIVLKRYSAISKVDKSEKWKTALDIVLLLLLSIDESIGDFILNLKIRNIRKALKVTKHIIFNKQWIQRDYLEETNGVFTVDTVRDYNINQATLIRAIGMGESIVYFSNYSDIPNIMYNKNATDLYLILVIKYCLERMENRYSTWEDTIDIGSFYEEIEGIFQNQNQVSLFKEAMEHLLIKRILLRSIDQLQNNTIPVNRENVSEITCVYLSNAAVDLWDLLGKSSVLMEMYMDDLWIDNSNRPKTKRKYRGFDNDNFSLAIDYIELLVNKELSFRNQAKNLGVYERYKNAFGADYICNQLLEGMINSLKAFYKVESDSLPEMKRLQNMIIVEE